MTIIYQHPSDLPAPSSIAIDAPAGALYSGDTLVAYSTGGHTRIDNLTDDPTITSRSLSSLSVDELEEVVSWLGVDTSARTKTGLKKAIERHLDLED